MANKLYEEEAVKAIAESIRVKLAIPDGKAYDGGEKRDISEMVKGIENIPLRLGFPSKGMKEITFSSGKYTATVNGWIYYTCTALSRNQDDARRIVLSNDTKGLKSEVYHYKKYTPTYYQYDYYYSTTTYWHWNGHIPAVYLVVPVSNGDTISLSNSLSTSGKTYLITESGSDERKNYMKAKS